MIDEPFTLANVAPFDVAQGKPKFENQPVRQTVLFAGLDCLAGQQDLFEMEGQDDADTRRTDG